MGTLLTATGLAAIDRPESDRETKRVDHENHPKCRRDNSETPPRYAGGATCTRPSSIASSPAICASDGRTSPALRSGVSVPTSTGSWACSAHAPRVAPRPERLCGRRPGRATWTYARDGRPRLARGRAQRSSLTRPVSRSSSSRERSISQMPTRCVRQSSPPSRARRSVSFSISAVSTSWTAAASRSCCTCDQTGPCKSTIRPNRSPHHRGDGPLRDPAYGRMIDRYEFPNSPRWLPTLAVSLPGTSVASAPSRRRPDRTHGVGARHELRAPHHERVHGRGRTNRGEVRVRVTDRGEGEPLIRSPMRPIRTDAACGWWRSWPIPSASPTTTSAVWARQAPRRFDSSCVSTL